MKVYPVFLLFILLQAGCSNESAQSDKFKISCINTAEKYISSQIDSAKRVQTPEGMIIIGNKTKTYVINPSNIHTGLINEDIEEDAILTLDIFNGRYQTTSEQLIMISSKHKPAINRVLESDMKILEIKEGTIVAEVPEHKRNSPLFDCSSCREIVNFKFIKGDLVKTGQ